MQAIKKILGQRILGQVRRAIQDFNMIQEGDRIAVGVSGGKDSLALLIALRKLKDFFPIPYHLEAVTLKMGPDDADFTPVRILCEEMGVNYTIEETLIRKVVFEVRKEKKACSLCANLKRGALHNVAKKLGCNKVALAHHMDDVIETFLLSAFFEGRIHTFSPVTYLERKDIYLIRPLIYVEEREIRGFIKANGNTVIPSSCPLSGKTKREYIKQLLLKLSLENRKIKSNLFGAIKRSGIEGWH